MSRFPAELGPSPVPELGAGGDAGVPPAGRRVFYGNFTCELEWGGPSLNPQAAATTPGRGGLLTSLADRLRPINAELAWSWLPLLRPGDVVLGVEPPALPAAGSGFPDPPSTRWREVECLPQPRPGMTGTLIPWGWTPPAQALAARLGQPVAIPSLAVVAGVNSRVRRWEWERELGMDLPGSQVIASLSDLSAALHTLPDPAAGWILKANFGMSGREAIRGTGAMVTEPQRRFVEQRLAATGPLVLEPLLNPLAEAGVQWELSANGTITLVGLAEQVAAGGSWQGSRWSSEPVPPAWREAVEATRQVAQRVAAAGYFGPLGIDVMRYRDAAGHERLRPLQDLNARFTMGRLALAWRDWLPAGWSGLWRVAPGVTAGVVRQFCEEVSRAGDREVLAWLTTPTTAGPPQGPEEGRSTPPLAEGRLNPSALQRLGANPSHPPPAPIRVLLAAADSSRLQTLEQQLANQLARRA